MSDAWSLSFNKKLETTQREKRESRKDFDFYRRQVEDLFSLLKKKLSKVEAIKVTYSMVTRTDSFRRGVRGEVQVIRTMNLSCDNQIISLVPEGINFGKARGRIRIRHSSKELPTYLYLLLMNKPNGQSEDDVVWAFKTEENQTEYPVFGEAAFEKLIEKCFLS